LLLQGPKRKLFPFASFSVESFDDPDDNLYDASGSFAFDASSAVVGVYV
jgi:hypothetical protein